MDSSTFQSVVSQQHTLLGEGMSAVQQHKLSEIVKELENVNMTHVWSAVEAAVREGRWNLVVAIATQCCSTLLRESVVGIVMAHGRWDCVMPIVHAGISQERRDAVFAWAGAHRQWDCVMQLAKLGVSHERRSVIIYDVIKDEHVLCCRELLLGLHQRHTVFALMHAVMNRQVDFLVELLKLCDDKDLIDIVMKQIVFQLHDGDTRALVVIKLVTSLGIKGEGLDELFTAIVDRQYADLLTALLSGGFRMREDFKQYCFRRQWEHMITESVVIAGRSWFLGLLGDLDVYYTFDVAVHCGHLDHTYYKAFLERCTEREQDRILRMLCVNGKSTNFCILADQCAKSVERRRKMFLMAVRFGFFDDAHYICNRSVSMADLVYAVKMSLMVSERESFTQGFNETESFSFIESLCSHTSVFWSAVDSVKANTLYMRVLKYLFKVVEALPAEEREKSEELKRFLFVFESYCKQDFATVSLIKKILRLGLKVVVTIDSTVDFHLLCRCVYTFCFAETERRVSGKFDYVEPGDADYDRMMERGSKHMKIIKIAFKAAFLQQHTLLVAYSCACLPATPVCYSRHVLPFVVQTAVEVENWSVLPLICTVAYMDKTSSEWLDYSKRYSLWACCLKECLSNLKDKPDVVKKSGTGEGSCAVVVEKWLISCLEFGESVGDGPGQSCFEASFFSQLEGAPDAGLAEWFCENSLPHLALLLSVAHNKVDTMVRVVEQFRDNIRRTMFGDAFSAIALKQDWAAALTFLKALPYTFRLRSILHVFSDNRLLPFAPLLKALKLSEENMWALCLVVEKKFWQNALVWMPWCEDQNAAAELVVNGAAFIKNWSVCQRHLERCTDESNLRMVFDSALLGTKTDVSAVIRYCANHVDWSDVVCFTANRSVCVLKALVQAGLSTFQKSPEQLKAVTSLLRKLFDERDSVTMKMLYRAGLWSQQVLLDAYHSLFDDDDSFRFHREADEVVALQVADFVAFIPHDPLNLQDLSRLAVSHRVGVHPGRQERIEALPVPYSIKELLRFSDLMDS